MDRAERPNQLLVIRFITGVLRAGRKRRPHSEGGLIRGLRPIPLGRVSKQGCNGQGGQEAGKKEGAPREEMLFRQPQSFNLRSRPARPDRLAVRSSRRTAS